MGCTNAVVPLDTAEIIRLHNEGLCPKQIAQRLGRNLMSVSNKIYKLRHQNILAPHKGPWTEERLDLARDGVNLSHNVLTVQRAVNALPGAHLSRENVRRRMTAIAVELAAADVPLDQRPRVTCIPPARAERDEAVLVVRRAPVVEETPRWMRPRATRVFTMVGVV